MVSGIAVPCCRHDSQAISGSHARGIQLAYVFDLLRVRDVDLRGKPLLKRKKLFEKLVSGNTRILYVDDIQHEG